MPDATDKFTRNFSDFSAYPWPGKIMPEYQEHREDAGDGNPGTQWMFQSGLSAYGPRHIIAGIVIQSGGTDSITGTAGYYMWDGKIKAWTLEGIALPGDNYIYISGNGSLYASAITAYNSGLMLAASGAGGIYNIEQRWEANRQQNIYANRINTIQLTGISASGFTYIGSITGQFSQINGFSDIECKSSFDFGALGISGTVTGSKGFFESLTGVDAQFTQITGTSGDIGDLQLNTTNLLPIGAVLMYDGSGIKGGDSGNIAIRTDEISVANGDDINMPGWWVCNGTGAGAAVWPESGAPPNLFDKFIMASGLSGAVGGSNTTTLTSTQLPAHTHTYSAWYNDAQGGNAARGSNGVGNPASPNTSSAGVGAAYDSRPAFYSMIYIKRVT